MPTVDGTLPPREPGDVLRRLREQAGRTVRDVSEALGWSSSKLSRIETSRSSVKADDLDRLLELYAVPDNERNDLAVLVRQPGRRLRRLTDALPDVYDKYTRLEPQAERISLYGAIVIPGLLQTPEYAAAVINAIAATDGHFMQTRMEARMVRQAILGRQPPIQLTVVLDEAALRRPVGGVDIMRRQMIRLQELNDREEVDIRVLPLAVGAHPALTGPFAILDFPAEASLSPAVFCDGLTGGVLRSRPDEVAMYRICFSALEELAVDQAQFGADFAAFVSVTQ